MGAPDLEFLLVESHQLKRRNDVIGVLLHRDGKFMQRFEGPEQAVAETYERIRASRRHKDLIELMNGAAGQPAAEPPGKPAPSAADQAAASSRRTRASGSVTIGQWPVGSSTTLKPCSWRTRWRIAAMVG
jgi:hypothetical protein